MLELLALHSCAQDCALEHALLLLQLLFDGAFARCDSRLCDPFAAIQQRPDEQLGSPCDLLTGLTVVCALLTLQSCMRSCSMSLESRLAMRLERPFQSFCFSFWLPFAAQLVALVLRQVFGGVPADCSDRVPCAHHCCPPLPTRSHVLFRPACARRSQLRSHLRRGLALAVRLLLLDTCVPNIDVRCNTRSCRERARRSRKHDAASSILSGPPRRSLLRLLRRSGALRDEGNRSKCGLAHACASTRCCAVVALFSTSECPSQLAARSIPRAA